MSAPEDKISGNRRRLFKALSAAPVVAVLKPGAALANASAFQCAAKLRVAPPPNWIAGIPATAVSVGDGIYTIDGFFFRSATFWLKENLKRPIEIDPSLPPRTGQACTAARALVRGVVVDFDGTFLSFDDSAAVPVPYVELVNVRISASNPDVLEVFRTDLPNQTPPCGYMLDGQKGLFSYVGFTDNNDAAWNQSGFFPEHTISRIDGAGELQGMTDSCMHSFMSSRTSLLGG
jgi:hypothetical protein